MIRRALLLSSAERYAVLALNFVTVAIVTRLLAPEEIGVSVLGAAVFAASESLRDFGTSGFLVQRPDLTRREVRTAFTVMLLLTLLLAAALWASAGAIASFYARPELEPFFEVASFGFLAGPVSAPLMALMRRDLAFDRVALINVVSATATAATTVVLAAAGAGFMSFAWSFVAGAWTATALAVLAGPRPWIFRPHLSGWREILTFGLYSSGVGVLGKLYEVMPSLLLGRLHGADAVGYYSRAAVICSLPDKAIMSGILPVALPALAAEVRQGRCLAPAYLRGLSYVTVAHWPALALVALLSEPIVHVMFGPRWESVIPVVQVMAVAAMLSAPSALTYPLLVTVGAIRDCLLATLGLLVVATAILLAAAPHGTLTVAASLFAILAIQSTINVAAIRRHVPLGTAGFIAALRPSLLVTLCCAAPAALVLGRGPLSGGITPSAAALASAAAALGWTVGVVLVRHPILAELRHARAALYRRGRLGRSIARMTGPLVRAVARA